ncbi:peroxidase family protein [Microlunatus ginsengisoli]|uniref:Heme peroxidase family protein n=1 Tax=Microlunatus ginsengisoli TaxID=363863 RepID=A0ABP6ZWX4_9ACTN
MTSTDQPRALDALSHGGTIAFPTSGHRNGNGSNGNGPGGNRSGAADGAEADLTSVSLAATSTAAITPTTRFGYLFPTLVDDPANRLPEGTDADRTVAALNALGVAMIEQGTELTALTSNSPIPSIYTFWGQFIDHDLTANTDRNDVVSILDTPLEPKPPADVIAGLENLRQPALNLDPVYGDGPYAAPDSEFVPYDGIKLRIGTLSSVPADGAPIPPVTDRARDLPRIGPMTDAAHPNPARALIGDARNDENLILAQLHLAFLRFHNAAVDWVRANEPERTTDGDVFRRARDLTRWAYQWATVNDFLTTVTEPGTVDRLLADDADLLDLSGRGTYMPLEFSVAAFRFGHSMIRGGYDWNRNHGRPGNNGESFATFDQLFEFTGRSANPFRGAPSLPDTWPAEWDRMIDKNSQVSERFARRIDTRLSPPLAVLLNEGLDPTLSMQVRELLKQLARRNLLRGFKLSLPTGQAVADALGLPKLTAAELLANAGPAVTQALEDGEFLDRTPLWFYILAEAEIRAEGASLGPVGSTLVAATIIAQLRNDPTSYVAQSGWSPRQGVRLADGSPVNTIAGFLRFAGVLVS